MIMGNPAKQLSGGRGAWLRGASFLSPLGQYDRILSTTLVKVHTSNVSNPYGDKGSRDRAEWVTKSKGSKH